MRSIILQGNVDIEQPVKESTPRTKMLAVILERPAEGYSTSQQRVAFKLLDAIQAAEESKAENLLVEDDQFDLLIELLDKFRWATTSKSIVAFINDIMGAEEVKPNK